MADKIKITILEDGTIKIDTDRISMPNHLSADKFLRDIFTQMGGEVTRKAKHAAQHLFGHKHGHSHDEHQHQ